MLKALNWLISLNFSKREIQGSNLSLNYQIIKEKINYVSDFNCLHKLAITLIKHLNVNLILPHLHYINTITNVIYIYI